MFWGTFNETLGVSEGFPRVSGDSRVSGVLHEFQNVPWSFMGLRRASRELSGTCRDVSLDFIGFHIVLERFKVVTRYGSLTVYEKFREQFQRVLSVSGCFIKLQTP